MKKLFAAAMILAATSTLAYAGDVGQTVAFNRPNPLLLSTQ